MTIRHFIGDGVYHGVYDRALALLPMARALRAAVVTSVFPGSGPVQGALLDLGCGTGRIGAEALAVHPGLDLWGVDYSEAMALAATGNGYPAGQLITGPETGNLKLDHWADALTGDARGPRRFGYVTMNMVAYMLTAGELRRIFGHVAGLLTPGGRFALSIIERGGDDGAFLARLDAELAGLVEEGRLSAGDRAKVMAANAALVGSGGFHKYASDEVEGWAVAAGLSLIAGAPVYSSSATGQPPGRVYARLLVFERPPSGPETQGSPAGTAGSAPQGT